MVEVDDSVAIALGDLGELLADRGVGDPQRRDPVVDDRAAGIGTANLDNRSFRLNFEVTAIVTEREFAAQVERMLEGDLERSRRVTGEQLHALPLWVRVAARGAYLLAPVL